MREGHSAQRCSAGPFRPANRQCLPYSSQLSASESQHGSASLRTLSSSPSNLSGGDPHLLPLRHTEPHRSPSHSYELPHTPPYLPHPAPRGCANPSLRMRLPPNRRLCVRRGHTPHSSLRPRRRRASSRRAPASPASAAPRTRNPRGWPAGGAQAQCAFPGSLVSAGPPPPHPSPRPPPPPPGAESR